MKRPALKARGIYLVWRDGHPRWEPGPRLRAAGWKGRDLKDDAGRWLGFEAAVAAAQELTLQARTGAAPKRRTPTKTTRSVAALWEAYAASQRFQSLAPRSQADYRNKIRPFLETFGGEPVAALAPHHLYAWWEELVPARGHAMANGIITVVRLVLSHTRRIGWRDDNPARKLEIVGVAPRVVVWLPDECEAFVAAADALGLHGLADAFFLALHTGQRQADVLGLPVPRIDGARAILRQGKTGARVSLPYTPALKARLDAILARRRALLLGAGDCPPGSRPPAPGNVVQLDAPLVLDGNGRRFTATTLNKAFRKVRSAIAATLPEAGKKEFRDLRDTAITRLALAGCTLPEIAAITGHEIKTIASVLKHYVALDALDADAAIGKLSDWMREEGVAV